jgi:hypothetical protein
VKKFKISLFDCKSDNAPKPAERTWSQIRSKVLRPPIRAEKDGALYSPAIFDPPRRLLKNAVEICLLRCDYDHDADFAGDLKPWRDLGCAFAAHTTFNHTEDSHRFRMMIPLAEPIPAADFPRLWKWASQISGGKIDAAASDASRMFYVPGRRSESAPYLFDIHAGDFLDWRSLDLPTIDLAPVVTRVASGDVPSNAIDSLLRKAFAAKNGGSVFRLYQGDTADYGNDDSRADQALCSKLAFWSGGNPQALDQMFRGSRLFRDKWDQRHGGDGRSYGEMTIDKALQGCSEFYTNGNGAVRSGSGSSALPTRRQNQKAVPGYKFTTLDELLSEPEEDVAYVWDKTLPRGGFSILAAKPKVGKSTFVRNLALAVSRGGEFMERATPKGLVIYCAFEDKRGEIRQQFKRMGASGADIITHIGGAPDSEQEFLEEAIIQYSPALVIIDPLSRFARGIADFNSYGEVARQLEPLIDLARSSACQTHIMCCHHNGKGGDLREAGDALLGSTGFFGAVDTLLTMRKREKVRTIESVQRYGEDLPETIVSLDPEVGIVCACGDMKEFTLNERKKAVLDSMSNDPVSEATIKELVGGTNGGLTSKAVRSLFEEGRLERSGKGKKGDPFLYWVPPAMNLPDEIYIPAGATDEEIDRICGSGNQKQFGPSPSA